MKIGALLKEYRTKQAKTKKEWAGNVISPSFYARIENGSNNATAKVIIGLLQVNKIPLAEFFGKLEHSSQLLDEKSREINRVIEEAYYNKSEVDLQRVYEIVNNSNLPNKENKLMLIDAYEALVNNDITSLDKKMQETIKERIINIDKFDVNDMNLYLNFIAFYNFSANCMISKGIIRQFNATDDFKIQKNVLSIGINMIILCIEHKYFERIGFYVEAIKDIKVLPENYFFKMIFAFLINLIKYHEEHERIYLDKCQNIIDNVSITGMLEYSKELANFLKENM